MGELLIATEQRKTPVFSRLRRRLRTTATAAGVAISFIGPIDIIDANFKQTYHNAPEPSTGSVLLDVGLILAGYAITAGALYRRTRAALSTSQNPPAEVVYISGENAEQQPDEKLRNI